ncbi:zinc ribbon domain-containing protein [Specibacter cremeus]|uniref:zinc ribbon domain-containing protein n=1 Tax=Specibacter cremeus TaxID=1629051 RepID=UPI000F7B0A65|nr:C4-type zinc ribbon domain-containing protein [Specibacter cremeus]
MAKAAPAEQLRLLDLQAVDGRLKALDGQAKVLREDPRLADLATGLAVAESDLAVLTSEVADIRRELTRFEDEVAQVTQRIIRDETKLNSGTGLSKDLVALQQDIESLTRRRSTLEDGELEAMEKADDAAGRRAAQQELVDDMRGVLAGVQAELGEKLAALSAERDAAVAERAALAATFEPGLLAVYERTLGRYGVGAARLFHGTSEGSGMQLSPGDLADIRGAAADDVVFCPDSGVILVRSPEWS